MKRVHQITGLVFLFVSVYVARESLSLTYYTLLGPGPGFFPLWLSIIMGLLAAALLYQSTFGQSDPLPSDFFPSKAGYMRIAAIIGSAIGMVALLNPLGFRLSTLAYLLFLLVALGRQNPVVTLLVGLAGSFGVYYVFVEWLKVPLPVGILGI